MNIDFSKLTRVTIVNDGGRQFEQYQVNVEPSVQDGGRTLKLFLTSTAQKLTKKESV